MTRFLCALCCVLLIVCPVFASDDDRPRVAGARTVAPIGAQGTRAPGSLTTIFASNGGYAGNTFDIVPSRPLRITGIDVNTDPAGLAVTVDVYYRKGTCVGYETNAMAWNLLASGTGTAAGTDNATFIDLPGAAGTTFDVNTTYGICVDMTSYPTTGINYTHGGPNTYSNADLSIVTNSGQASPAFAGGFFYRIWNGTIYYDDGGPDLPWADVTCNGLDLGVSMYAGINARVDYEFHAGIGAGVNVDLWLALNTPMGFFTYDGSGPYMGWNLGLGNAFLSGPLTQTTGTCLDYPLAIGSYKAFAAIDTRPDGVLSMGALFSADSVDFDVVPPPRVYKWDDGSTENLLAWTSGGEICWFNMWDAYAGGETIVDVQCIFGSAMYPSYAPGNGTPCQVFVWDDPNDDGDPGDCVLVTTENIAVAQVDTDIYNVFPLSVPAVIVKQFAVGCNMPHAVGEYCMPMDNHGTYLSGASWYCGTNTPPFDPNNLMNNQYPPAEYGVFNCIRAGY